jgi:hypothetical protein
VTALEYLLPAIEPHPDLIAATYPTPRQVAEMAALTGWLSDADARWIAPAVKANES